ncbi:MAG: ribosome silencing factor [Deltaproteobacteria bacterium CG11_big_fil_rev_8_21_14_0_20_49_13]|nr:MAG: ribosome silencing factor [Deltaproteobacteria bacterium CG11_big_fil_rev_8_21_14_0_20_49_13]
MRKTDPTLTFAKDVARAAAKIKAHGLKILDLRHLFTFADYFVIASGNSDRQVGAIADSIIFEMKKQGKTPIGVEGYQHSQWIIVDFGDIVAHVFYGPMREIYSIEKLWADAKKVRVPSEKRKSAVKKEKKGKKKS